MKSLGEKASAGDVKAKAELKRMEMEDPSTHVSIFVFLLYFIGALLA
jgi:hypothetical protein